MTLAPVVPRSLVRRLSQGVLLRAPLGALAALLLACPASGGAGTSAGSASGNGTPPPPPPSASATANACAAGGDVITDKVSAPLLARKAGDYCIQGDAKSYGADGAKYGRDEVCTTAFDGGCKEYEDLGYKRYVSVRYVDGTGKPNTIDVGLWQFADASSAYEIFTRHVISGADPTTSKTKPLSGGPNAGPDDTGPFSFGVGAIGGGNASLWKGQYVLELTFNTDDPNMTKAQLVKASQLAIAPIATAIGNLLPGPAELIAPAKALPPRNLLPLGIEYQGKDALGIKGLGAAAIGYYQDQGTAERWRMVAIVRDNAAQAGDAMRALGAGANATAFPGVGDEAKTLTVDTCDYVFARKGNMVMGVGAEAFGRESDRMARDKRVAKLKAWLAPAAPAPATPATSATTKRSLIELGSSAGQ